ncbi:MAG: hypothetical protein AAF653_17005, partial [Chloroflexota bacterium]
NFEGAPITCSALLYGSAASGYFIAERSIVLCIVSFTILATLFPVSTRVNWIAWIIESSFGAIGTAIFFVLSLLVLVQDGKTIRIIVTSIAMVVYIFYSLSWLSDAWSSSAYTKKETLPTFYRIITVIPFITVFTFYVLLLIPRIWM